MTLPDVPRDVTATHPDGSPDMPLARLRAQLESAARDYAAAASPGSPLVHVTIFGREDGEVRHLTICPAPSTPTPPPPPAA